MGISPWSQNGTWKPDFMQGPSFLVSKESHADFRLSVEFKPDAFVNSGLFFRCQKGNPISPEHCYEANIWDDHPTQAHRTGAVVMVFGPPMVELNTVGKWNRYEVEAVGDSIHVRLNGQTTAKFTDDRFSRGQIALQWSGEGRIEFRNFSIEPIVSQQ